MQHFNHENLTAPRAFWEEYQKHTGTKPTYQAAGSMAQCYALQAALMITDSLEGSDIMRALMSLYVSGWRVERSSVVAHRFTWRRTQV